MDEVTVRLWNFALSRIGAEPLTGPDDQSQTAERVRRMWDTIRRAVLRPYPWNCAMERARLAADMQRPAWGYAHAYRLPGDCLMVVEVAGQTRADGAWTVERGRVLSDRAGPLDICYVADIGAHQMDAHLCEVMALRLAAALAFPVTNNASLTTALEQEARRAEVLARATDAREAADTAGIVADEWTAVRQ